MIRFVSIFYLIVLFFGTSTLALASKNKTLQMFIWSSELAPIISKGEGTDKVLDLMQYQGIFVDIMAKLPTELQVSIDVSLIGRARGEKELYKGVYDLSILSKEWLSQPEALVYTKPIYVHREYLYAVSEIPDVSLEKIINKAFICTRRNYLYPKLKDYFDRKIAVRMDSFSEEAQFKMLLKGRCDFVVTNEFVGQAIIDKYQLHNQVKHSFKSLDEVNFTIAFHPRNKQFVTILNKHIEMLAETGQLEEIIDTHRFSAVR
ncbi:substrate-binding periplasmic protein [Aliiglaciecola lipolytica]|uniref:Uncharacterized protein n=1 Tax=Aliiglaciecola lipolytica E3 TaxID=1127673 RepID=K6Y8A2_9ALTE|nr:transporter substrate-binding domain-containing protein [Aliiglaciecola lipolytica]GAC14432.1 hypothetical protein GLIP_1803 [Aliiglaciecola lipolytica E3]